MLPKSSLCSHIIEHGNEPFNWIPDKVDPGDFMPNSLVRTGYEVEVAFMNDVLAFFQAVLAQTGAKLILCGLVPTMRGISSR